MLFEAIWDALGGRPEAAESLSIVGSGRGSLPSVFAVSDLAAASVAAAAVAVAELIGVGWGPGQRPGVEVDRRLASLWFASSLRPQGWRVPPAWDAVAGDYPTRDGWIRLHTNAPHHRAVALHVLEVPSEAPERAVVASAVVGWNALDLENAIVEAGGCAAAMHSLEAWAVHPQGRAVSAEPLVHVTETDAGPSPAWSVSRARPLQGVRVLDLTRILAGPVATRFLAGFGADVLRIDPPGWDEPGGVPEVTLGKRCARLDLRDASQLEQLRTLVAEADVLVHGYRPDALARLGLDAAHRRELRPGLVDVCLDAYGWSGPWRERRGFDSLVQMSSGIADAGMRRLGRDRPTPLPVQALDQATGYVLAAAAVRGLTGRLSTGKGCEVRTSLARTAALLVSVPPLRNADAGDGGDLAPETEADRSETLESTAWGPAYRLKPPARVGEAAMHWQRPATRLGSDAAHW